MFDNIQYFKKIKFLKIKLKIILKYFKNIL